MRSNKKGIIISVIFILIIAAAVLAYLFLMTDVFKSNRELFAKYFVQNLESLEETTDFKMVEVYKNIESENIYESNIKANVIHSEGGEISNPLNNLSMKLDIQKDNDEQYFYADGQILYEDEECLEAEIIKDRGNYGIRFTDVVKQFVTVKKDENLETVTNDIGMDMAQSEMILNIIDGNWIGKQQEQVSSLKHKYMSIITTAISNGIFEKQKNALITYNDTTTKTNAYSVSLNSEQVANLVVEILNNVKNETEILDEVEFLFNKDGISEQIDEIIRKINEELEMPTIKITVYENNQKNIRTEIQIGVDKIVIENTNQNGEAKSKVKYSRANGEQTAQYDCEITNLNPAGQREFRINLDVVDGEKEYTVTLANKLENVDNIIKINTTIAHTEEITTTSMELENEIKIGNNFEKTVSLTVGGNYIPLDDMKVEKRKELINLLKGIVPQKITEKSESLKSKLIKQETTNIETENIQTENTEVVEEMSQVEINKFNAKFEFYTGDEVSTENVKMLLDIVKNNMKGHSIETNEVEGDNEKTNIIIYIEKDSKEGNIIEILEKINSNTKYKISISYNEQNGLIETINIKEV